MWVSRTLSESRHYPRANGTIAQYDLLRTQSKAQTGGNNEDMKPPPPYPTPNTTWNFPPCNKNTKCNITNFQLPHKDYDSSLSIAPPWERPWWCRIGEAIRCNTPIATQKSFSHCTYSHYQGTLVSPITWKLATAQPNSQLSTVAVMGLAGSQPTARNTCRCKSQRDTTPQHTKNWTRWCHGEYTQMTQQIGQPTSPVEPASRVKLHSMYRTNHYSVPPYITTIYNRCSARELRSHHILPIK